MLGPMQLERVSILLDVLEGKKRFLFYDEPIVNQKDALYPDYYFMICSWLVHNAVFNDNKGEIKLISKYPIKDIIDFYFKYENEFLARHSFIQYWGEHGITIHDSFNLLNFYMNKRIEYQDYMKKDPMNRCVVQIVNEVPNSLNILLDGYVVEGRFSINDVFFNTRSFELMKMVSLYTMDNKAATEFTQYKNKFYCRTERLHITSKPLKMKGNIRKGDILLKIDDEEIIRKYYG